MTRANHWLSTVFLIISLPHPAPAQTIKLYDGSLNTPPTQQGRLAFFGTSPDLSTTANGKTTLDTTADPASQAGFATHGILGNPINPTNPVLDRTTGYRVSIDDLLITADSFSNDSRSGFSLIVVGHDRQGIELEFRRDAIFALSDSPLFTRAESTTTATPTVNHDYDLWITPTGYTLMLADIALLSGPLRDYSAFVPPFPVADPYETPNFIFFGDNTTSAAASSQFSGVSVTTNTLVPEPTALALILLAPLALLRRTPK